MRPDKRTLFTIAVGAVLCLVGGLVGRTYDFGEDEMAAVLIAILVLTSLTDRARFWATPWTRRR
jgi:hypothetical protein